MSSLNEEFGINNSKFINNSELFINKIQVKMENKYNNYLSNPVDSLLNMRSALRKVSFLLCMLASMAGHGQDPNKLNILPLTPNVASMARYGNYEVSLFTGLPQINIPLYEIKTKNLSVPISLSYHASGIKVTDVASWVGLGWNLNAGGAIYRSIIGKPDELNDIGYINCSNEIKTAINNASADDMTYVRFNAQSTATTGRDYEPDIFSYNIPGRSGKFLFNRKDRTVGQPNQPIIFIPHETMQLNYSILPNTSSFDFLELKDERGVSYQFGKSSNGTIYTENTISSTGGNTGTSGTSTWWLTEMVSEEDNDDRVRFSYSGDNNLKTIYYDVLDKLVVDDRKVCNSYCNLLTSGVKVATTMNHYTLATPKKLEQITFPNGKLEFELSLTNREDTYTGWEEKSLSKIKVYAKNVVSQEYVLIKTILFNYDYFLNTDNVTKRLKLESIHIIDSKGEKVQSYKFTYNPQRLPHTLSKARDYYGYYNGATGNTSLIPQTSISFINDAGISSTITISNGNSREVDQTMTDANLKACILTRIDYPTGGYSEFEYEANRYQFGSLIRKGGGLRIYKISSYDASNTAPIVKTYKYGENESGLGNLNTASGLLPEDRYFFNTENSTEFHKLLSSPGSPAGYIKMRSRTFLSNTSLSLNGFDGSSVVYTNVAEYVGDETTNIGKTIYKFEHVNDLIDNSNITLPHPYQYHLKTYHWARGNLLQKDIYNAQGQLLSRLVNTYQTLNEINYTHAGFQSYEYVNFLDNSDAPRVPGNPDYITYTFGYTQNYSIITGVKKLSKTIETIYNQNALTTTGGDGVTTTTEYIYRNDPPNTKVHLQPIETRTSTSYANEYVVNKMKYVPDYVVPAGTNDPIALGIKNLQDKHIISPVIEQYSLRQSIAANGTVSNARVIGGTITIYKPDRPVPHEVRTLDINEAIPPTTGTDGANVFKESAMSTTNMTNTFIQDGSYSAKAEFVSYDAQGNLLQHRKANDVNTVYIWGYNGTLPIAQVVNATKEHVYHTSFEDIAGSVAGGKAGKYCRKINGAAYPLPNLPNFPTVNATTNQSNGYGARYVLSFWYCSGDPTKLSDWKLFEQAYTTAPTQIPANASYQYIDEVRIFPESAMMTTYTYEPLVGVLSVTDPNNTSAYYVYDEFQRLKMVKDQDGNVLQKTQYHYKGQPMKAE